MLSNGSPLYTGRTMWTCSLLVLSIVVLFTAPVGAQTSEEHRWNFNVGAGVTPLVGDISSRLTTGWHVTVGGGVTNRSII